MAKTRIARVQPIHRGAWSALGVYAALDIVTSNGASYMCVQDNTGAELTDDAYWRMLAEKGDVGPEGPQGPAGPEGPQGTKGDPGDMTAEELDAAIGAAVEPVASQLAAFASDVTELKELKDAIVSDTYEFDDLSTYEVYGSFNVKLIAEIAEEAYTINKIKIRAYKHTGSTYKFKLFSWYINGTTLWTNGITSEITLDVPTGDYADYIVTLETPLTINAGSSVGIVATDGYWLRHSATGMTGTKVRSDAYANYTDNYRIVTWVPDTSELKLPITLYTTQLLLKDFATEAELITVTDEKLGDIKADVNIKALWQSGKISSNSVGAISENAKYISTTAYIPDDIDFIRNADPTNYGLRVYAYDTDNSCLGCWDGTACVLYNEYDVSDVNLNTIRWVYPNCKIKISLYALSLADVTTSVYVKANFFKYRSYSKGESILWVGKTVFVSTSGNDESAGTKAAPVATVNRALMLGASNICVFGGIYDQSIDLAKARVPHVSISAYEADKRVIFRASDSLICDAESAVNGYTKVYSASTDKTFAAAVSRIFQDGVPDAATAIDNDERHPLQRGSFYRCEDTKIYKCTQTVLANALAEIESATTFKWFFDSGTIYFSRPQTVNTANPLRTSFYTEKLFSNASRDISLEVSGIESKYMPFNVSPVANADVTDCKVANACGGGFVYDSCLNAKFVRCESANAFSGGLGDGFASAGSPSYGGAKGSTVTLIDCWSHDNNDDGFSDHNGTESTLIGGLFEFNGKGGVLPAGGNHCTCYNVLSRHNDYGFFYGGEASDSGNGGQMICYTCVADSNTGGNGEAKVGYAIANDNNTVILINCKAFGNVIGYRGTYNTVGSEMVLIDCGASGNSTSATSQTVTVKNTTLVTT